MVVFATGYMVGLAMQAARELEDRISVKVVNVSTIKPMDANAAVSYTHLDVYKRQSLYRCRYHMAWLFW